MTRNTKLPATPAAAIAAGSLHYFTGKPCKRGHVAPRRVSTRTCIDCGRLLVRAWSDKNSDRRREQARQSYQRNIEKARKRGLDYHYANRDVAIQRMTARRRGDPIAHAEAHRRWAQANPGKVRALAMARHAAKLRRTPKWADLAAIRAFYEACPQGHHVDHIVPLRGELVSGLHVLENLQYLPARDNMLKSNQWNIDDDST